MKKIAIRLILTVFVFILGLSVFAGCGEPEGGGDNGTVSVTSVTLNKSELTLKVGENETLTAIVLPDNATTKTVVWTSSNESVAIVANGKVFAQSKGTATITVTTTDGGKTATCIVTVTEDSQTPPAHTHAYTKQVVENEYLANPATCNAKAKYYYSCECGVRGENTFEYGDKLVHKFTNYVSDGNATYTSDGTKTAKCDNGCGETDTIQDIGSMLVYSGLEFKTLTVSGTNVNGILANSVSEFSFLSEVETSGDAKYIVALDIYGMQTVVSKTVTLNVGDNVFYVLETLDDELENTYKVTIRRRPTYTVYFNTNGGTSVSSQVIEESFLATEPTTTRAGYDFVSWDYDFTKAIMGNTTVNASWSAHIDTPYTVEYYLQNLADDNYTKVLTENKTGKTDTAANAEIKTYEHFTYNEYKSNASGNIDGNGSRVLKVYYTRDKYEVVFLANGGTKTSGSATQYIKYEGSATAPTYTRTGYAFDGFDKEYTNISEDIEVTAQWIANEYTVTLNVNGGNALSQITKKVNYDSDYTLSVPTRENCDFLGWYNGSTLITDEKGKSLSRWTFTTDIELTAKWGLPEGIEISTYVRIDNKVYMGEYPQTEVTDSTLISTLNSLAGTLPTSENAQDWTSYGYYISSSVQNYMWYIDIISGGEKYRGVYFTKYRPYYTGSSSSSGNSYQPDNGYNKETVYWFKYEPISWTILDESKGLILCDMIIDSQQYDAGYSNNYANSDIRAWLNDTFYNTAFTTLQQSIIKTTTVDNSARSTNPNNNATQWNDGENSYACADTQDKVFLLSMQEVTNSAYGFDADPYEYDTARRKKTTDYAQSQGCYTYSGGTYDGNGYWWLRSPGCDYSFSVWYVYGGGFAFDYYFVYRTRYGVVPALQIQF